MFYDSLCGKRKHYKKHRSPSDSKRHVSTKKKMIGKRDTHLVCSTYPCVIKDDGDIFGDYVSYFFNQL